MSRFHLSQRGLDLSGCPVMGTNFFSPGRWLLRTLKGLLLFLCKAPLLTTTKSSALESHRRLLSPCSWQGIKRGLRTLEVTQSSE